MGETGSDTAKMAGSDLRIPTRGEQEAHPGFQPPDAVITTIDFGGSPMDLILKIVKALNRILKIVKAINLGMVYWQSVIPHYRNTQA